MIASLPKVPLSGGISHAAAAGADTTARTTSPSHVDFIGPCSTRGRPSENGLRAPGLRAVQGPPRPRSLEPDSPEPTAIQKVAA